MKRIIAMLIAAVMMLSISTTALAETDLRFSNEYKGSPFYTKLITALDDSKDKTTMEKTLAVALSQEGYKNYATTGIDIEQARTDGFLWTGTELRMNNNLTGNTEYTRWAQRYVLDRAESTQYEDIDWCAIFASWCMYQAGYYDKEELKRCYYSYYANPTVSYDADGWILAYNLDQHNVWYTPTAANYLDTYNWNTYYNTDVDPYEIDYKPGGLLFFSWDGGVSADFDHVGIVVSYDKDEHIITYSNGNSDGQVITREMDLDTEEEFRGMPLMQNSKRIAAYGEYDEIKPLDQKNITSETTSITWDKSTTSGIKIQTDSNSKICKVYVDGDYLGSNIESNMVLLGGRMAIGKSELISIPVGSHTLTLTFEDGNLNLPLTITDVTNEPSTSESEPASSETEPASSEASSESEPAPVEKTPKLSAKTASLNAGKTITLKVSNGTANTWLSSETSVATVKNGKITALKKGTAMVYALLKDGRYLSCKVSVKTSPKLSKSSVTVNKGKTVKVKITGKASSVKNVYTNTKTAKITSKNTATSLVVKGLKKGSTTLKVKVNGVVLKLKVKVK